ncbi:hypothetical protein [Kitasatospora sp. LaBMicrA B282]|uniref:hypothetical protein n=1 Tax=Kitasatospora sp. LaBMicrA B282 TaxID=3420949 RepID=UPI003D0C2C69
MTEKLTLRSRAVLEPLLHPGERLLDVAAGYPVAGATGVGHGPSARVGNAISRIGAVSGGQTSLAAGFPVRIPESQKLLAVTDRRVLYVGGKADFRTPGRIAWELPREFVTRVERRPRTQLMARFRLHFADGSAVSILTLRRAAIETLAAALATPAAAAPQDAVRWACLPQDAAPPWGATPWGAAPDDAAR